MKTFALALVAFVLLAGCGGDTGTQKGPEQRFAMEGEFDFAGSHILVAYAGARRADPSVTRTQEEALARAQDLIAQLKQDPSQFEEMARQASDGPSGPTGGNLRAWKKGQMTPEFDAAIEPMAIGSISEEPVETPFGYHIIRRNPLDVAHYGGDAFFIGFAGAPQAPDIARTEEEAQALAEEIKTQLTADTFDELAAEHNDFGDGAIFLGVFKDGDPVPPELIETLAGLDYGEVGGPVSFPVGIAFVRRMELEQRAGAHILIAYQGAMRADSAITRTKAEAQARAAALITELQAAPDQFAALAAEHSDGPSGPAGGSLGVWFKGQMVPEFDTAIDGLTVDAITPEPVETPFGYHVIQRRAVAE